MTSATLGGFDLLTVPDQARVDEMLNASGLPEHLRGVDPDEEVAAASAQWTTQREPPPSLLAPMLPYQKEGLGWLCAQEEGEMRGGILADEMGMGKTLQTISLTCAHKAKGRTPPGDAVKAEESGVPLLGGGNLVIVPVIALAQWRMELLKGTAPGEFSVYTYHGAKREADPAELAKYDVILTTYATLEYEYRIAKAETNPCCHLCGQRFKTEMQLANHTSLLPRQEPEREAHGEAGEDAARRAAAPAIPTTTTTTTTTIRITRTRTGAA